MIEIQNLVKRYGTKTVVDDVSFRVEPGRVTGFLGPNGAGKSTTMRMILGLDRPTSGAATVDGRAYASLPSPITSVGATGLGPTDLGGASSHSTVRRSTR